MTDDKRMRLVNRINRAHPLKLGVYMDETREKLQPSYFELSHDGVTVCVGTVFGDLRFVEDKTGECLYVRKMGVIPDRFIEIADQAIIDYGKTLGIKEVEDDG